MKRLILILLILGLCYTISSAGITDKLKSVIARQTVAGGASCTLLDDDFEAADGTDATADGWTADGDENFHVLEDPRGLAVRVKSVQHRDRAKAVGDDVDVAIGYVAFLCHMFQQGA